MKSRKLFILISFLLSIAMGCKKDLVLDSNLTIVNTKIYDDSLIKPDNSIFKITEDGNKMFICYGNKNADVFTNGGASFIDSKTNIISIDYSGNILWKAKIPDKLELGNILPIGNGACLVSASLGLRDVPNFNYGPIYLFQFDKNGNQIALNTAVFPPSIKILNHSLLLLANGNVLAFGSYYNFNDFDTKGFSAEFTISGELVWGKTHIVSGNQNINNMILHEGTITQAGDFVFIGEYTENENSQALFLIKTDATGETSFVKKFPNLNQQYINRFSNCRIIEKSNNNYLLSLHRKASNKSVLGLYNINSIGDSLSYKEIDILNNNFSTVLLPLENEKIFCLVNSFEHDYATINEYQVFKQVNTNYLILNSNLGIDVKSPFQTRTTDFVNAACKRADGSIANFGVIQPRGKNYYKPQLIIIK